MPHVRRVGLEWEDRAAEFLSQQGYTLLTRRFKAGGGEIDLVCLDGSVLAFVEVKQRRSGSALDSIDLEKRTKIFLAGAVYLSRYDGPPGEVRYDVVTIEPEGIKLHKDAFRPR